MRGVTAEAVDALGFAEEEVDGVHRIDASVQDRAAGLGRIEQAMIGRCVERETETGRDVPDLAQLT